MLVIIIINQIYITNVFLKQYKNNFKVCADSFFVVWTDNVKTYTANFVLTFSTLNVQVIILSSDDYVVNKISCVTLHSGI